MIWTFQSLQVDAHNLELTSAHWAALFDLDHDLDVPLVSFPHDPRFRSSLTYSAYKEA